MNLGTLFFITMAHMGTLFTGICLGWVLRSVRCEEVRDEKS